ncbi:MAG: hypothetical protein GY730_06720 [bacterium]|nr:hypothetical protein [bacterium]
MPKTREIITYYDEIDIVKNQVYFLMQDIIDREYIFERNEELANLAEQVKATEQKNLNISFIELVEKHDLSEHLKELVREYAYTDDGIYEYA